jgi:F-type H+-transporting ATPase subunit c
MTRKIAWLVFAAVVALILAPVSFAQGAAPAAHSYDWIDFAAALALGLAAMGCGLGQGRATAAACESTARNPGAAGPIRISFIIGVALIESLTLYVLVVVLIK